MYKYDIKKFTQHGRLSIEKLREFKGLENVTDEKAEEIIKTIETIARAATNAYQELKTKADETDRNNLISAVCKRKQKR